MPFRPPPRPYPSSSSSTIQQHVPSQSLYKLFAGMTFHIVSAKLEEDMARLYEYIDELGGRCVGVEDAWFIVTALKGRARLARSLDAHWLDSKPVLSVKYVYDAYETCLKAATSQSPSSPRLPPRDKYCLAFKPQQPLTASYPIPEALDEVQEPPIKRRRMERSPIYGESESHDDMGLFDPDVRLEDIPASCVLRGSPLICVNQDIVDAIRPIFQEREFEELQQKNSNVLSYRRSLSILKSVPRKITSGQEALKLQGVGEKVAKRIDEFLRTGTVAESQTILSSPRFLALLAFASVYTIGHHRARELYDLHHCRSLEDVKRHFADMEGDGEDTKDEREKVKRRKEGRMKAVEIVEEWMKLKEELDQPIPREEVEEIAACIMEHVGAFISDCQHTICGGYRRGKTQSNDVDVVLCPPEQDQDIGLLRAAYLRMSQLGIITHVLHVTHRDIATPIRAAPQNFDNLDKAFVIFKLPGPGRLHRRVDIISAPRDRYASAILSWTGSMMYERDLKRYAENERGYKFRAGLIEIASGKEVNLGTEREIFKFLGLKYVPPELRNAD
ncbi:hypothetical protein L202_02797 [Cryptococcus amylolentus CBS 6039]|uniref:DNA polymerase n=1 Tax=Cryptococcus amylolentus CBS 6039 TaxID=1295533 RepID=A0A1E3HWB3_9TREE|nr:hypothetical protein L202_02797 [Cryptococcus amylolentus CBS 6039]ODN80607.1 hypothetical protein L202_02797 [Cryptococcus amylolentus CBS 6039]